MLGLGCVCVFLCVTKGNPWSLSVPAWANQSCERSSLQGCKCGFTSLGLRRLLTFSGSDSERAARRAGVWWCAGAFSAVEGGRARRDL